MKNDDGGMMNFIVIIISDQFTIENPNSKSFRIRMQTSTEITCIHDHQVTVVWRDVVEK